MKTIHKYLIDTDSQGIELNLKRGYKVVHSEYLLTEKKISIWVEEALAASIPLETVKLRVAKSGDPLPVHCEHFASAIDNFAPEAYHIFEYPEQISSTGPIDINRKSSVAA